MEHGTKALLGGVASSLTFGKPRRGMLLSNAGAAVVYGKLNWKAADTEVSATVFDILIKAGDSLLLNFASGQQPTIDNVRLISASNASLGYVAE